MSESGNRVRYERRLAVGRLAGIACVSPYGETGATTVCRLRLHRAAGYLANGSVPIAEVAERSGYSSLQFFSRTFRAVFGVPPAQYR
ncbi:helix-turn-helix transcriptional regulator [Paraburkholderia sp. SG-MS1]|uniref:helix-turn-helix transcriptional regulator n=1 Tax=Paraburkholderia sp. SG-MS1 TaxID=2023741 RepID=UPI00237AB54F|nr:helix-turn-helix transcriptional regulator [Paraburkholderia sp. SG-MS1]